MDSLIDIGSCDKVGRMWKTNVNPDKFSGG